MTMRQTLLGAKGRLLSFSRSSNNSSAASQPSDRDLSDLDLGLEVGDDQFYDDEGDYIDLRDDQIDTSDTPSDGDELDGPIDGIDDSDWH